MVKIHAPIYWHIYEREGTQWFFHGGKVFYNPRSSACKHKRFKLLSKAMRETTLTANKP